MCTVVLGFAPEADIPLMLVGVRDEFAGRAWLPPDRHWPDHPGVIGGLDLLAGGTWLAVDPALPRAAALLNGRGAPAPEDRRRSRGELPLLAVRAGDLPDRDPAHYDPFHLVLAEPTGVRLWHWDGEVLTEDKLPEGVHIIVNSGWERGDENERVAHFRPLFSAAWPVGSGPRPAALREDDAERRWRRWRDLASGEGIPVDDPRALVVRHDLGERGVWGTSSITLLALAPGGVRYDFCPRPDDPSTWYPVLGEDPAAAMP
ncbi:NRDE family protein [Thermopolyspora sp. NPDC052614]|uniref:NRDE family protein n=1 Tax=Thermopolyspora sp. NPDC052614 TaxID=3155682 RepID=UPI003422B036